MAVFEPFEPEPHLAVGVSGGADSLALCLLAWNWARARGGRVTALTVDHGLRAESPGEAATVGAWLGARAIDHRLLSWAGAKPRTGIQAAAREARRRLLGEWCRDAGVLHLLLAHHRDDQGETVLLRRERASGPAGLAGMAAVAESEWGRVLRPLLEVPPDRLKAALRAHGQAWIEDPSNRDPAFARTRLRAAGGGASAGAAMAAGEAGRARFALDAALADFLARHALISPAGYCRIALEKLAGAAPALRRRAIERSLMTVSGRIYPPRGHRLDRLVAALATAKLGRGATLAGCRLVVTGGDLLVVREPAAVEGPVPVAAGGALFWDRRFKIRLSGPPSSSVGVPPALKIAAIGRIGYAQLRRDAAAIAALGIPSVAAVTLPALWDLDGVRAVPHLTYGRRPADPDSVNVVAVAFCPAHPWAGAGFGVSLPNDGLDGWAAG